MYTYIYIYIYAYGSVEAGPDSCASACGLVAAASVYILHKYAYIKNTVYILYTYWEADIYIYAEYLRVQPEVLLH